MEISLGLYWPDTDLRADTRFARYRAACLCGMKIGELAPRHKCVVQAGGHIGMWPLVLSHFFTQVRTFEPAPSNWEALVRNLEKQDRHQRVTAVQGALDSCVRRVGLTQKIQRSGNWHIAEGDTVQTYVIDHLDTQVDAIVLDIEGWELPALQGAEQTIQRWHPLVWVEVHEHQAERGGGFTKIHDLLMRHGYNAPQPQPGRGRDVYFTHPEWAKP